MPKFTFTSYRRDTRRWTKNGCEIATHTLELSGTGGDSGEINRAILIFDSETDLQRTRRQGTVGYITSRSEGGASLVGWLPPRELPIYLDILSRGEPVSIDVVLHDPRAQVGYIRRLGIGHHDKILAATLCLPTHTEPRGASNVVRFPI